MKYEIKKQRNFSSEYDYGAFSVVRLQSSLLKNLGGRNTWVKISSPSCCVFRLALGLGGRDNKIGFTSKAIEIDYEACIELDIINNKSPKDENQFYPCDLTIQKANFFGRFVAHWKHPNPGYRVPMQLSIVGFMLGLMGLVLGVLGYA